jgi:hypothetical protein
MPVMTALDPLDASARVVADRFPEAIAAFLAGSVLTSRRTALSDLDIVVVLPGPPAPFRDTVRAHGWVVELFVHTPTSIAHYWEADRAQWRCTLARMCTEGRLLVDVGGAGGRLQHEARALLEAGPPPVPATELERRRYMLTDSLDDLRGSRDPVEDVFIAAGLIVGAGELAVLAQGGWLASGKWVPRTLAGMPGDLGHVLAGAARALARDGDKQPLDDAVTGALRLAGGPLTEGYTVAGVDPDHPDPLAP